MRWSEVVLRMTRMVDLELVKMSEWRLKRISMLVEVMVYSNWKFILL